MNMSSTPELRHVTIAGTTGSLGPSLITHLSSLPFTLQLLTRANGLPKPSFSNNIPIHHVDYTDIAALSHLLTGQDAVISCLGDPADAVLAQENLLEAALQAGVKRFIPSEFGSDTKREEVSGMPFFGPKVKMQARLKKAVEENNAGFTFSVLITGPWLDWGLSCVPWILDVAEPRIYDNGSTRFSTTRLSTVCTAIGKILRCPPETANRILYISEATITQNDLLRHLDVPALEVQSIDTAGMELDAWTAYDEGRGAEEWVYKFIDLSIWRRGELCLFEKNDNELLGVENLVGMELEQVLREEIRKAVVKFGPPGAGDSVAGNSAAERAFEAGRKKLAGFAAA